MATFGSFLATAWQLNGSGLAADGFEEGSKWQRIGAKVAAFGSGIQLPGLAWRS